MLGPSRPTPIVGRERELVTLLQSLEAAGQGQGGVVLVAGEPGIGKTRLLAEFGARARRQGWRVLSGCASETEGVPPYLPFTEALRDYARSCPLDDLPEQLGASASDVALLVPALRERLPDLPAAAPSAPEYERYRLFESVSDLLLRIATRAETRGLLLMLDDLQWADAPSLLLLLHLALRSREAPLLLAGAYRATDLARAHPLAGVLADLHRERLSRRLALAPLSEDETLAQISALTGRPVAATVASSMQRETQGNPFFTEEVVSALAAEGRDLADPEAAFGRWAIPEGVREAIGRRLGRLSTGTNQLLQAASVLGESFGIALLKAVSGLTIEALAEALDEAVRAGLLREERDGYAFRHALIRQTLAEEQNLPRRQRLHLRAAEAIEQVHARRLAQHLSLLATHYRLAGAAADPEKAITYSLQAGEQAQRVYAWEEAASHWQAATELMEESGAEPERRADLLVRLGDLIFATEWGTPRGREALEAALGLYAACGLRQQEAEVHARLGRYLATDVLTQDLPRALTHLQMARPLLETQPESALLGYLYTGLAAAALFTLPRESGASHLLERAVAIGEHLGAVDLQGQALAFYSLWSTYRGRLAEATACSTRAWELAASRGRLATSALITEVAAVRSLFLGDPRAALGWVQRWLEQPAARQTASLRATFLDRKMSAHYLLGEVEAMRRLAEEPSARPRAPYVVRMALGDWSWAGTDAEQAAEAAQLRGDRHIHALCLSRAADTLRLAGAAAAAEAAARAALGLLPGERYPLLELRYRSSLALLLAETCRPAEARAEVERCRAMVANGEDWRGPLGTVERADAATLAAEGNLAAASPRFEQALGIFQQYGLVWEEAETRLVWGCFLFSGGKPERERAKQHFAAATAIYQRIGAGEPWIQRVQQSQARLEAHASLSPESRALSPRFPDGLSEREVEVLRLIAAGRSNQAIADELVISLNTVARHVTHIFEKTCASNRAEAGAYAVRNALLE